MATQFTDELQADPVPTEVIMPQSGPDPVPTEVVMPPQGGAAAKLSQLASMQQRKLNPVSAQTQASAAATQAQLDGVNSAISHVGGMATPDTPTISPDQGLIDPVSRRQSDVARAVKLTGFRGPLTPELEDHLLETLNRTEQEAQAHAQAAKLAADDPAAYAAQQRAHIDAWAQQNGMGHLYGPHTGGQSPAPHPNSPITPPTNGSHAPAPHQAPREAPQNYGGETAQPHNSTAPANTAPVRTSVSQPVAPSPKGSSANSGIASRGAQAAQASQNSGGSAANSGLATKGVQAAQNGGQAPTKKSRPAPPSTKMADAGAAAIGQANSPTPSVIPAPAPGPGVVERVLRSGPNADVNSMRNWPDAMHPAPPKQPNTFPQAQVSDFIPNIPQIPMTGISQLYAGDPVIQPLRKPKK